LTATGKIGGFVEGERLRPRLAEPFDAVGLFRERAGQPELRAVRDDLAPRILGLAFADTVSPNALQLPWPSCALTDIAAAPAATSPTAMARILAFIAHLQLRVLARPF
jgi:hypothetical protein